MKTLEHEIRDVLNRIQLDERKKSSKISSDNALNVASLVPGPVGMAASAEIARREAMKGNYSDAALSGLGVIPFFGRVTSGVRVGSKLATKLRKRPKTAKRKGGKGSGKRSDNRKGGKWGRRLAALGLLGAGGGSPSKRTDKSGKPPDLKHSGRRWIGGSHPTEYTVESREDIEATPRFTETDREKIDVVPRAENDLEVANRKRFRMENIKKKIIDESLNIINSRK